MPKKFTRTVEDFVCEKCGNKVKGTGYTNHCPSCLWSKHVDKNPGDRLEACGGLMEPARTEKEGKKYMIVHKCVRCGYERRNSLLSGDSFDAYVSIARRNSDKFSQAK